MIQLDLSDKQLNSLHHIIDQANKQYLRQSNYTYKSSFNILPILSTYRLLYQDRQPKLYQAIINMTKGYNPQTFTQWKKALNNLSMLKTQQTKITNNYIRSKQSLQTKTSYNSFSRSKLNQNEHIKSQSFGQINLPKEINYSKIDSFLDEQQKQISQVQTNAQTGKRQYNKPYSFSIGQHPKNHYISFQPYKKSIELFNQHQYQKQNINYTNIDQSRRKQSAYYYIEAIRSLNKTSKNSLLRTPIDQSFIKNINHSQSSHLISKVNQEYIDPEEEQMNQRASIFNLCNLKLKVLSSLLANFLVCKKIKQYLAKAQMQSKATLKQKAFITLKMNAKMMKQLKLKEQKADQLYSMTLKQKSVKILKLIYELKDKKVVSLEKFNKMNFKFLLQIIIETNYEKQQRQNISIDLQRKIYEYLQDNEIQKLSIILRYFGKHGWISQENVRNLIFKYKQSLCRQVFSAFHTSTAKNRKYKLYRETNLKKQSFFGLKLRWKHFKAQNKRFLEMQAKKNKHLLEKAMKGLITSIYSTKLYSKRCQYIRKQNEYKTKQNIMIIWIQKAKQKSKIQKQLISKGLQFNEKFINFLKKYSFLKISEFNNFIIQKIISIKQMSLKYNKIYFLKSLKLNNQQKTKYCQKQKEIKQIKSKIIFNSWRQKTTKMKTIIKLSNCIKKIFYRAVVGPMLTQNIILFKELKAQQKQFLKKIFKQFKRTQQNENKKMQELIKKIKDKMKFSYNLQFLSILKSNQRYEKQQKRNKLQNYKIQIIKQNIKISKTSQSILKIKHNLLLSKSIHKKTQNIKKLTNKNRFNSFYQKLKQNKKYDNNIEQIKKNIKKNKALQIIKNLTINVHQQKIKKIIQIRKSNLSKELSTILQNNIKIKIKNINKANLFFKMNLFNKVIKSFNNFHQLLLKTQKIAAKINKHLNFTIKKTNLQNWRKSFQIQKIYNKIQKKFFLKELKKKLQNKKKQKNITNKIYMADGKRLMNDLVNLKKQKIKSQQINQSSLFFAKWLLINNIKRLYKTSLIDRKHFYMSIKFRALKLTKSAFKSLAINNNGKNTLNNEIIHSLTYHNVKKERLSTHWN